MTLLELMFAGFVLTIGMLGSLVLILTAIATNSRNKFDTTGTMAAQMVIEQINVMSTNNNVTTLPITDCATANHPTPTTWTIAVQAGLVNAPTGAAITTVDVPGIPQGSIDFTQAYSAVPANYKMLYYTCGDVVYDIRWNIMQLTDLTKLVVVSARQGGGNNRNLRDFSLPVSLRTISGP